MNTELLAALIAAGIIDQETAEIIERQSDPVVARAWAEAQLTTATAASLQAQLGRLLELVGEPGDSEAAQRLAKAWRKEDDLMWANMRGSLATIATERATIQAVLGGQIDTFNMINEQVLEWLETHYQSAMPDDHGSIPNLNRVSREQFATEFELWQRGEVPADDPSGLLGLIRQLEAIFGMARAERIAVTETSRIFSESVRQAALANPFTTHLRWLTAVDETVCPWCRPRHNMVVVKSANGFAHPLLGGVAWPPAHVMCRCSIVEETEGSLTVLPGALPVQ